jgi:tRNA dimethylallyltransferase
MQPPLIVIAGPTASGKSQLALTLAQALNGVLICADSRQIYRDFEIGTAAPNEAERALVPHALFNVIDPRHTYTVAEYQQAVEALLPELWATGKTPILVGGTGLYLRSLLYAYQIPEVPPQDSLRQQLNAQEAQESGCLHRQLQAVDAESAARLHPHDTRRIIRALEVYHLTGQAISALQKRSSTPRYPHCAYLGLRVERGLLEQRIRARIALMLEQGLIAEVERLRSTYGHDLPLLQTLNYLEVSDYLDGKLDLPQTQELMAIHTRQYAKRQMTWFRQDNLHWIDWQAQPQDLDRAVEWVQQRLAPGATRHV